MNWLILAWAVVAAILALELYGYRKLRKLHAFMRNSLRLRRLLLRNRNRRGTGRKDGRRAMRRKCR